MNDDDRRCALSLMKETISGVVFSILNVLDNNSGFVIQTKHCERVRVLLDIMLRDNEGLCVEGSPVETININEEEGYSLHQRWLDWLEDYSKEIE